MSDDYKMPEVFPGDVVLFSRIPEDEPRQPLIVSKIFGTNLNGLWISDNTGIQGKLGVRHVDDPHWRKHPDSIVDSGVWKASPTMELRYRVKVLEAQVEKLVGELEEVKLNGDGKKSKKAVAAT